VGVTVALRVGLEQGFQAGLTAALVTVTAYYAYSTRQILEVSKKQAISASKQAQIMLDGQFQAEAPVLRLRAYKESANSKDIRIEVENIGKGPALNIKCWIDDPKHPELRENIMSWTAVAVGQGSYTTLVTGKQVYSLQNITIKAHYESIFHKKYESCLMFSDDVDSRPSLFYRAYREETQY
jgi:hypothetical protein